ncbi:MAG: hypothetical protein VX640_05330 [Pseudomonadota bacterium]|nr:hypothetical protein [Pseudomonadota bacterium]
MDPLLRIKSHVDAHGVGCVIVNDHVAIGVLWKSRTIGGEERLLERIERVRSLDEACCVIGCDCCKADRPKS